MKKTIWVLLALFSLQAVVAQQGVVLTGIVKGKAESPLLGATVLLEGTEYVTTTDANGVFKFEQVVPKTYNLTVSIDGYETQTVFNVIVKSAGNAELTINLVESAQELTEVVIKRSKLKRSKETPLSIQSLSAVEIANYPGSNNDVVRVAQSLPGISPSPGGFRNDLIIRGGAPNETVYYLDGMEIPTINHFSTQGSSGGPVGILNVSFIDDVTLSTSAFGSQYDNPLSGVLQFKQRTGSATSYKTNFRLSASEAAATFEGPLFKGNKEKSNTTFLASVRRSYLQFLFEFIGLPIRPNYWDYQYKINHKIDAYNDISLIGVGSIDEFSLEASNDLTPSERAVLEQSPYIEQRSNAIGLTWKRRFKNNLGNAQTTISNNYFKNSFVNYEDTVNREGIIFSNEAEEIETKLRQEFTYYFDKVKVTTGFNGQLSRYNNNTIDSNSGTYSTSIDFFKYGFFANASSSFFDDRVDFSAGFRFDDDTFLDNVSLLETFSPRVALSVKLGQGYRFNASVGSYYKILPYTILGFRDQNGELANRNGNYTNSTHYVAGIEKTIGEASKLTVEGFYKKYRDYPVSLEDGVSLANKGGGFEVLGNEAIATNGRGRTYGAEVMFQQKFVKNFFAIASYTFFYSEFSGVANKYLPSVWDSRHLFSLTAGYKFKKNWEVSLRNRFAGRTPYVPVDQQQTLAAYPEIILDYNALGTKKLGVFNQLDVRVDKKWNFKKVALDVFVDFENLLAQRIPQIPQFGLLRDENDAVVSPRQLIQVDNSNNTIIPTVGLVLDF
ncbi:TonB-dependent receptor [Flavobacterium sp.]|uniref:TonB-dependent receptor n=1 Tax=Flavobacterium sp. TaxID=239 RepID=UPI003B9A6261